MNTVAIILANNKFIKAYFLKIKMHIAEIATFVYILLNEKEMKKSLNTIPLKI